MDGLNCSACNAPLPVIAQRGMIIRCDYCGTEHSLPKDVRVIVAENNRAFAVKLGNAIAGAFNSLDEVRYLVSHFSGMDNVVGYRLSFDDVYGSTVTLKCLELAMWAFRRQLLQDLTDAVVELRPRIDLT